jgi:hypothetical protein
MSLTNFSLPIVSANNASTYYVSMQPIITGSSTSEFISPNLKFNLITNKITVNDVLVVKKPRLTTSNSKPINPNVGDIWYDSSTDIQFQYIYDGINYVWVDISTAATASGFSNLAPLPITPTPAPVPTPFLVNYLVVAGGGAGGSGIYGLAGGGGAGGLLQGCTTLTPGSTYTITVGGGGAAAPRSPPVAPTFASANGTNSTISSSAPGFSTITAYGGGAGGFYISPSQCIAATDFRGKFGGSGGGAGAVCNPSIGSISGGFATGSPGQGVAGTQGYPGGNQILGSPYDAAGGGGAGGVGGTGSAVGAVRGGVGGAGVVWSFTGNTYASGGAGGSYSTAGNFTPATPGGGGAGGSAYPTGPGIGGAGTPGTGGGGGGAGGYGVPTLIGGNGGPGVVIFAIPTPNYPGGYGPIATTPPSAPGKTVLTFTANSSYIA